MASDLFLQIRKHRCKPFFQSSQLPISQLLCLTALSLTEKCLISLKVNSPFLRARVWYAQRCPSSVHNKIYSL